MARLKARRKIQYGDKFYSPDGVCSCDPANCHQRVEEDGTVVRCTGQVATGCQCTDEAYCGRTIGAGSCAIPPEHYGGEYIELNLQNPIAQYFLSQGHAEHVEDEVVVDKVPVTV